MKNMQKLFEDYLRSTPVRSPFSQANYYSGGRVRGDTFQDYTDLYNTTYRTHHESEGFDEVMYSEPLNVLVAYPAEGAERFENLNEGECFVKLGLKAARGFKKDYRFLDQSIPGSGKVVVDEETADRIVEEPFEALREARPTYTRNFGETPAERIDEATERDLNRIVREELEKELESFEKKDLGLSEKENRTARKALRKLQLENELPRYIDALADNAAKRLRESGKATRPEKEIITEAINQIR
jgi:hypothetical protein